MLFLVGKDLKRVVIVISPRITLFWGRIYGNHGNGNSILLKYYCSTINEDDPKGFTRVSVLN